MVRLMFDSRSLSQAESVSVSASISGSGTAYGFNFWNSFFGVGKHEDCGKCFPQSSMSVRAERPIRWKRDWEFIASETNIQVQIDIIYIINILSNG